MNHRVVVGDGISGYIHLVTTDVCAQFGLVQRPDSKEFGADAEAVEISLRGQIVCHVAYLRPPTPCLLSGKRVETDRFEGDTWPRQTAGVLKESGGSADLSVDLPSLVDTIHIGAVDVQPRGNTALHAHTPHHVTPRVALSTSDGAEVAGVAVFVSVVVADACICRPCQIEFGQLHPVVT